MVAGRQLVWASSAFWRTLVVDDGATEAITGKGRSLLASGVREVEGRFEGGACVRCVDPKGKEFARGLVNYSAAELERIKGCHSSKIEGVLGYKLTDWARAFAGYTIVYASDVLRPGLQFDPGINPTQAPAINGGGASINTFVGSPRPQVNFNTCDFWAQGLNLGIEFSY